MSSVLACDIHEDSEEQLVFAIPKKGRLSERCLKLLDGAGIYFNRRARLDVADASNLPIKIAFLPAADIATFVHKGNVDLGITGQDIVAEHQADVMEYEKLGFGKCKLCVQTPVKDKYTDPKTLSAKRITTSFTTLTKKYFKDLGVECPEINYVTGSVEAACALGLADAVVDLVETGTTMRAAGLEILDVVLKTEAVLIGQKGLDPNCAKAKFIQKIHQRIKGFTLAQRNRLITYNCRADRIDEAKAITPGVTAPTVLPLVDKNWCSVSAMVKTKEVSDIMDRLKAIDCQGIIVSALANFQP